MKGLKIFGFAGAAFLIAGCGKPDNFKYFEPQPKSYSFTQDVKSVTVNKAVDIFWAIGGMTEQAPNFQSGVNQFMTDFTKQGFSWRMAVVSSNNTQPPFLGMPAPFDNSDANPIGDFVNGIVAALNGQDLEMIFDPVAQNLQTYQQSFLRPDATLAVILTNDNPDESTTYKSATQLLNFLASLKGGDASKVIVYGVFGATDLHCPTYQIDMDWNFHGTEFENLINVTGGQAYSLCDATFGQSLAKIGDSLYEHLSYPRIILPEKADPNSITVLYKGNPLPGGDPSTGGIWYFDIATNSVVFYNLTFAKMATDQVTVNYLEYMTVQ